MKGAEAAPGRLAAGQVRREALRLLARLAKDNGYLEPVAAVDGEIGLFGRRNGYARPVAMVARAIVDAFAGTGWIERDEVGRWRLGDAGRAWLRRQAAGADPFSEQHQLRGRATMRGEDGVDRSLLVNEAESPLGWLRRRKDRNGAPLINDAQFRAGERLRDDYYRAQLSPRVTANWTASQSSRRQRHAGPSDAAALSDSVLAAKQRVHTALDAVGPELAGVLVDVCCHHVGLAAQEKAQGWPQRSGKIILQIALTGLARHYGLIVEDAAAAKRPMRSWGDGQHRPNLDAWREPS